MLGSRSGGTGSLGPMGFSFLQRALGGGIGNLASGCVLPVEFEVPEQGPVVGPTVLFLLGDTPTAWFPVYWLDTPKCWKTS